MVTSFKTDFTHIPTHIYYTHVKKTILLQIKRDAPNTIARLKLIKVKLLQCNNNVEN